MINAELYNYVYIIFIGTLTLISMFKYSTYSEAHLILNKTQKFSIPSIILCVILIIFIGFRPLSGKFVDMMNYNEGYLLKAYNKEQFEFDPSQQNFIFDNLLSYLATNLYDIIIFFFLISVIYFGCMYISIQKIFQNDTFYAFLIYLGAFSTFSYGTNGIKAGAAASIFLLAFAYYKKPLLAALFCFISLGFHHSMTLPIVAFISAYFIKNPKYFFWAWFICLFITIFHFNWITNILAELTDDLTAERYILADPTGWSNKTGFRLDFVLYSFPPIIIGLWTIYKHNAIDRLYQIILCTYLAANAIWLLSMYVPYNNRIAYLSWFILPIATVYPFFKLKLGTRQYIQLNYVVSVYLAFTIFSIFFL